jgi:hypothetical protein
MASYAATLATHQTLTAATVDTVTFDSDCNSVEVKNRSTGTDSVSFSVDGSTPTALGVNTYYVGPGEALIVDVPTSGNSVVKLISAGTPAYSVTKVS